jgi:hypothetical protein
VWMHGYTCRKVRLPMNDTRRMALYVKVKTPTCLAGLAALIKVRSWGGDESNYTQQHRSPPNLNAHRPIGTWERAVLLHPPTTNCWCSLLLSAALCCSLLLSAALLLRASLSLFLCLLCAPLSKPCFSTRCRPCMANSKKQTR